MSIHSSLSAVEEQDRPGVIIQARNGSSRLPGKVMIVSAGKTIIEHVVARVRLSERVGKVVVATTTNSIDDAMAVLLQDKGVDVFRGSEQDVLDRYYRCADAFSLSHVVRITADCPLIDPALIDIVIARYQSEHADYCSNILERTYPDGMDVEVFSFWSLARSWREASAQRDREHVTLFIRNNPNIFRLSGVTHIPSMGQKRWTLDYTEDFEVIDQILCHFAGKKDHFTMDDVSEFLAAHPKWEAHNARHVKY